MTDVYPCGTVKEAQRRLLAMGLYTGKVDGMPGPLTQAAFNALFNNQRVKYLGSWDAARRLTAVSQALCRIDGIEVGDIDGLKGPQTVYAYSVYDARMAGDTTVETWRDFADQQPPLQPAPPKATVWPRQADVRAFFGPEGANQTTVVLPYPMKVAWNLSQRITKTSCNVKVKPALERIWGRTLEHYGITKIVELKLDLFGGCLNVRKIRGGTSWSMHAYGIAWDVDPERNALKMGRDEATLDAKVYDPFWGFVEAEGAVSLGRLRNYDWMHFQFARL